MLNRRWPHHAKHSGYDQWERYLGQSFARKPIPSLLLPNRIFWLMTYNTTGYDRTGVALELFAACHMATHRNNIYHILEGETCYKFLGALNGWRGHRVVVTFHKPPHAFGEMIRTTKALKQLAAVIVVGSNQIPLFTDFLPRERIFFVPHPIDTAFFIPPPDFTQREEHLCLFVGSHLRDFATLRTVIEDTYIVAPHLRFVVVAHPDDFGEFKGVVGNLTIYSDITEAELLKLYQKASLLIQPLQDTTANNAILEAMACGLPMVITDIGAARDYVTEDCACFVPAFNSAAMITAILHLINTPKKRQSMSIAARVRALTLDWHVVAKQMNNVYRQILSTPS